MNPQPRPEVHPPCSTNGCSGKAKRWGRCQRCGAPPVVRERALAIHRERGLLAAAEATGLSPSTVDRWRRDAGAPKVHRRGEPDGLGLTGQEVADAVGASYRQVDNWQRTGLAGPSAQGSGHFRRYSPADVEAVRVVARLVEAGMRVDHLREMELDERARLLKVLEAEGFTKEAS